MIEKSRKEYLEKLVDEYVISYAENSYEWIGEIDYLDEIKRINSGMMSVMDLVFEGFDDYITRDEELGLTEEEIEYCEDYFLKNERDLFDLFIQNYPDELVID